MQYIDEGLYKFNCACTEYKGGSFNELQDFVSYAKELGIGKIDEIIYVKGNPTEPVVLYSENADLTGCEKFSLRKPSMDDILELQLTMLPGNKISEEDNLAVIKAFLNTVFLSVNSNRLTIISKFNLMHDELTGIHNQNYFMRNLYEITGKGLAANYTAFYMNIRNCRFLNKVFGNYATDEIIKYFAVNFDAMTDKENGECLSRLGGDFFTLLALKENVDKYVKLLTSFPVDFTFGTDRISYTISLRAGAAALTPFFDTPDKIMSAITAAFSLTKSIKENPAIVFYDARINDEYYESSDVERDLRKDLHDEKLLVYYQPYIKVCQATHTEAIVGCEALLRWRRMDRMITPDEIIPIAEHGKFISEIDFYVLDKVCQKIKDLKDRGTPVVPASVNFSEFDLKINDLASRIIGLIDSYGVDHSLIWIEFNETAFMSEPFLMQFVIDELHAAGIRVGIDNCSDSFFSFKTLTGYKFDYIKIDYRSIDTSDSKKLTVLNCVIHLSKKLGIDIIIEGISNDDLIDEVKSTGCTIFQSNYFEKPMSERFFENKLKNC